MQTPEELKRLVKEKYAEIALQDAVTNKTSCCGATCCGTDDVYNIMSDDYTELNGYNPDADLGLGCGLPTQFAKIQKGNTVVDLGSGAGNDCFVARHECGAEGKVIGVDFTEAMIEKARANAEKLGFNNVEFRYGDIEKIPITSDVVDVVVSNCVLNLVPNKKQVFSEIYRVLRKGGHFSISDVVLVGELSPSLRRVAEFYAGCVSGAIQKSEYLDLITQAGFANIQLQKEKAIEIPENILAQYLSAEELQEFKESNVGIFSITVYAEKPTTAACCTEKGCC